MTSARYEPCRNCGDPTYVCPGHIRIHTRCCPHCTHHFPIDRDYAKQLDWARRYRQTNP